MIIYHSLDRAMIHFDYTLADVQSSLNVNLTFSQITKRCKCLILTCRFRQLLHKCYCSSSWPTFFMHGIIFHYGTLAVVLFSRKLTF